MLSKETDGRPYVVCIDLNLPTDPGGEVEAWAAELQRRVLAPVGSEKTGEPDRFSAAFFTNYSWHWDGNRPAGNPLSFVIRGLDAAVPLKANEIELLSEAVFQYGDVPEGAAAIAR